ncbi:uncharacterized protein [Asterias amurensis]|uniref:uncharacterized protein n=1 Tax=Asterias amurensis TaxID=7602 RepID=UPI003AB7EE2F
MYNSGVIFVFAHRVVNKIICSDASSTGAGVIICNEVHTAHKLWTNTESVQSSTWRELEAIRFALLSFLPSIHASKLKLLTDSQCAAKIIESGSMKPNLNNLVVDIFNICLNNSIRIDVEWIPRAKNDQADFVSRILDTDDWSLSEKFFSLINARWGPFTIDCFAISYNAKLPRFYSRFWNLGSSGVDAFAQNWHGENALLVPPVAVVASTLKHMHLCKCKGVIIFPWWPSQPFWPLLWSQYRTWVKDLITEVGYLALKHGRNHNSLLGSNDFKGCVAAAYLDFVQI